MGCPHGSVDQSAPFMLWPWVQISRRTSLFLSIFTLIMMWKGQKLTERGRDKPKFFRKIKIYISSLNLPWLKEELNLHKSTTHDREWPVCWKQEMYQWTLISNPSDPYKFCFYCPATHVTSQVLQPKSEHRRYRGRHMFITLYCVFILTLFQPFNIFVFQ